MANRRGSLELNFKNIFNLVIGALLLIAVLVGSYRLYGLFAHGEEDFRAKQNLDLLERQIKISQETGKDTALVLQMPVHYALIGFGDDDESIRFIGQPSDYMRHIDIGSAQAAPLSLSRPCDTSCICAYRMVSDYYDMKDSRKGVSIALEKVDCREFDDMDTISGSWRELRFRNEIIKIDVDLFLSVPEGVLVLDGARGPEEGKIGPVSVLIHTDRNSITLSQETPSVRQQAPTTLEEERALATAQPVGPRI